MGRFTLDFYDAGTMAGPLPDGARWGEGANVHIPVTRLVQKYGPDLEFPEPTRGDELRQELRDAGVPKEGIQAAEDLFNNPYSILPEEVTFSLENVRTDLFLEGRLGYGSEVGQAGRGVFGRGFVAASYERAEGDVCFVNTRAGIDLVNRAESAVLEAMDDVSSGLRDIGEKDLERLADRAGLRDENRQAWIEEGMDAIDVLNGEVPERRAKLARDVTEVAEEARGLIQGVSCTSVTAHTAAVSFGGEVGYGWGDQAQYTELALKAGVGADLTVLTADLTNMIEPFDGRLDMGLGKNQGAAPFASANAELGLALRAGGALDLRGKGGEWSVAAYAGVEYVSDGYGLEGSRLDHGLNGIRAGDGTLSPKASVGFSMSF